MKEAATLSRRESEIAELIAWGAPKKEISNRLFISVRTVENETRNIFKKIGVSKSNELSAWWFCTKYRISFTESPLLKRIASILTLMTLSSQIAKVLMFFSIIISSTIL